MNAKKVPKQIKLFCLGDLKDICYRCLKKGHIKRDCQMSRTPSASRRKKNSNKFLSPIKFKNYSL